MYRQRDEVRGGGANYSTELAGRDRFMFFRRPVEPSGGELHAGGGGVARTTTDAKVSTWSAANVRYADLTSAAASSIPLGGASAVSIPSQRRYGRRPSSVEPLRASGQWQQSRSRRRLDGSVGGAGPRPRTHHLPTLEGVGPGAAYDKSNNNVATKQGAACDAEVQTMYRENEAQTDPYSPDYIIPDGAQEPEVLKLLGLTARNGGLPAGQEEVALIQRLRRRREVEATVPRGNDAVSIEARFRTLHALEEEEWAEREEHVAALQQRRHERITESLLEREAAREEANRERLEAIKQQYLTDLSGRLSSMQARSLADSRRATDRRIARRRAAGDADGAATISGGGGATGGGATATRPVGAGATYGVDLIASYAQYGSRAAPPSATGDAGAAANHTVAGGTATFPSTRAMAYDVRPALLTDVDGVDEVEGARAAALTQVPGSALRAPVNDATARLPTLHRRHEAERVVQSLEHAQTQIDAAKAASVRLAASKATISSTKESGSGTNVASTDAAVGGSPPLQELVEEVTRPRSVLDLYRAPPKVQRPNTPELELDGDAQEDEEEACILLQRLLRGRAVQNDFFEGKERCRGLIQELQAASAAKEAEHAVANARALEELAEQQSDMVAHVLAAAVGDLISDTLGYLYQEKERRADAHKLDALRAEAESVRQAREAVELARRDAERLQRDRAALQYAALVRATSSTATAFIEQICAQAVQDTAAAVAVEAERTRQAALPPPRDPMGDDAAALAAKESLVCDMLDEFVIPTIVDSIALQERRRTREAPHGAASVVAREVSRGVDGKMDTAS